MSSDSDDTNGIIMMPMTRPADRALKTSMSGKILTRNTCVTNSRAKNPNTTVGMPASTSSVGLSTLRTRRLAYSDM